MADTDSKSMLLLTENERLQQTIRDRDNEVETWKKRLTNMDQEYRRQMEQLREQLNTSTTQVIVIYILLKTSQSDRTSKLETKQADWNPREPSWKTNSRPPTPRSSLWKTRSMNLTERSNVHVRRTLSNSLETTSLMLELPLPVTVKRRSNTLRRSLNKSERLMLKS